MRELLERVDPGFIEPVWLIVGLIAVVAVLLLELGSRRRRVQALRQFVASHLIQTLTASVSAHKRLLKRILLLVAVGLLFIALARPHLFYGWREESRSGLDILVAVDCSKSMLTEDVKPNRLERSKLALADFADHLPDNRLGLIAFAGDAFLQCPLTLDHDAFNTAVRELDTSTIPRPGTDIATAIDQAVMALQSQPNNMKFLILITDGEDLEGRALESAKAATRNGLKIYTVGVGTPNGDRIPDHDDAGNLVGFHHDSSGQVVESRLDENMLRQIAEATGGAYLPLGQGGEGLERIYNDYIATLPKQHFEERREKVRFEHFEWPLAAAILALMWEFLTTERAPAPPPSAVTGAVRPLVKRRSKKPALAVAKLVALGIFLLLPAARAASTDKAERQYKSGNYEQALQNYREATQGLPDRRDIQYNRGDAAYKAGEYREAEEAFRKTLETPDLALQESTYYNLGNTQYRHGEAMLKDDSKDNKKTINLWEQALKSYEASLKLNPSVDAKYNYEFVKKKLEQLKQQQQQQQQKDKQSKPDQKDQKDQSGKGSQQDQGSDKGQGQPQDQNGGQNPSPSSPDNNSQSQQGQEGKDGKDKQDQNGAGGSKGQSNSSQRGTSDAREQDQQDPGVKSRQEAEALLDSLKDDERHVTARSLNRSNEQPPPPSGKDW